MKSRLFSFLLLIAAVGAQLLHAYPVSFYAANSRLSSGHWVKIATDVEGIYQLTYDELRSLGFDDPARVQVYGYGSTVLADNLFTAGAPDDLSPTATLHTPDGRILFFGQGDVSASSNSVTGVELSRFTVRRNYYDTRSYYFLSDAEGVADIPVKAAKEASDSYGPVDFHIHLDYFDHEEQNPIDGGIGYHGAEVHPGDCIPYAVRIRNFRASDVCSNGIFNYFVPVSSSQTTRLSTRLDGEIDSIGGGSTMAWAISDGEYTAYNDACGYVSFAASAEHPLADTYVTFNVQIPAALTPRYIAPDRAAVRYPRANVLDDTDPMLILNYSRGESMAGRQMVFSDVDSADDMMVWNIDNLTKIAAYPTTYDAAQRTLSYVLTENYTQRSVAFRTSAHYPSPAVLGSVPAQNLHGSATPNMLIITTAEYYEQAVRLAAAHEQYQGLKVNVVLQDAVFNEFSSGARDAMAYRRLAKMYFDRDPAKFKYMLLFGSCNYDNRSLEVAPADRLLTYQNTITSQTSNMITNYASDNYFGILADNYNHNNIHYRTYDIAVGRVPALTSAQAADYVDKAIRHLSGVDADYRAYSRALLCAGEGDLNTHIGHSREVADTILSYRPEFTIINVPTQLYRKDRNDTNTAFRDIVRQELQRGVGYFTYSGHGDPNFIGDAAQWNRSYAAATEYPTMPLVMFSSCDQYCFDRNINCLVEAMLFVPRGGCLAAVGASRSVYISYNQLSTLSMARAYAEAAPTDTYGDVYVRARRHVITQYIDGRIMNIDNALINTLIYNLAGDPALPVYAPACTAVVAEIDGHEATSDIEVLPLKPFHVKGAIADAQGNVDADFNGSVTVRIIAAAVSNNTYNSRDEGDYESVAVSQQFTPLVDVEANVCDGLFDVVVTAPVPSPVGHNRLIVYAADKATGRTALGSFEHLTVGDYSPENYVDAVFEAPAILDFRAGDADFVSGSETAADVQLTAIIDPSDCGLDFSEFGIATHTSLTIDRVRSVDRLDRFVSRRDDGTMALCTTIDGLAEGVHTVTLTVTNNAGLVDRATIDFVVVSRLERPALTADCDIARQSVELDLAGSAGSESVLLIADSHGRTVSRVDHATFPYTWDLCDSDGTPVPDGRYTATVLIRSAQDYTHSHPATFTILR